MDQEQGSSVENSASGSSQNNSGFVKKNFENPGLATTLPQNGIKAFYNANKFYFWAIILGLVIIGVLSFFAFRKTPAVAPSEAKVSVTIDAPETVASGADAVYKIKIENQDSQKLVGIQLELAYPDGVTYTSSSPKASNLSGSIFSVPDLIPGQNAVVIVKAKASGNINDIKTLKATAHYRYSNFSSEFTAEKDFTVRLTASDVAVNLDGPATINNAQLVVYNINYQNNSTADVKNARIVFNAPDGFSISSSNPTADLGSNTWSIPALTQGGQGTIQISGAFHSVNPGESKNATVDFLVLGGAGDYFVQSSSSFSIVIANVPLVVSQNLLQDNGTQVLNPGDLLSVVVKYQNNDIVPATGVNISVSLDGKALDLSTLQAQGAQINNGTLTWNAASNSKLETLTPNESGSLAFSVKIKNPATKDSSKNLSLVSAVKISSNEYTNPFTGNELDLKISSPSSITSSVSYLNGALPPQVGKSTGYRVTLSLRNATNDFSNAVIAAFIPLGAGSFDLSSVNSAETGKVNYDNSTGKLTWNVLNLPAHTGQFTPPRVLQFNVNLNPSSSQVRQSPVLVKTIIMSATDIFTNQPIQNQIDDITTRDIPGDNFNNGIVAP